MCIFWGGAGIPAELIIQHSLDGFSVFLCYKHDKDQTVQCPGWSFSSVEWMKAPKMNSQGSLKGARREILGWVCRYSQVWKRMFSSSLSTQLHCPWLAALETGKKKKNQYLESWDWMGHKSWVLTWGNQARAREGDALTKRRLVV